MKNIVLTAKIFVRPDSPHKICMVNVRTVFCILPQSFDLCLLCHALDGMRRWELAFSLPRAAHGLTPGVACEPNRSMDDMKST
jgi:hypothetical protein